MDSIMNDRIGETEAGQRRINIIWEMTQSLIAIAVVITFLYVTTKMIIKSDMNDIAFIVLSNIVALVIGFYFGRTNHAKIGGVGPNQEGR